MTDALNEHDTRELRKRIVDKMRDDLAFADPVDEDIAEAVMTVVRPHIERLTAARKSETRAGMEYRERCMRLVDERDNAIGERDELGRMLTDAHEYARRMDSLRYRVMRAAGALEDHDDDELVNTVEQLAARETRAAIRQGADRIGEATEARLSGELADAEQLIESLRAENRRLTVDSRDADRARKHTERKLALQGDRLEEREQSIETLRAENKRLIEERDSLRQRLHDVQSEHGRQRQHLTDRHERQAQTIREQREDIGRLTEQRDAAASETERVGQLARDRDDKRDRQAQTIREQREDVVRLTDQLGAVEELAQQCEANAAMFRAHHNPSERDLGKLHVLAHHAKAIRDALGDSEVTDESRSVQSAPENETFRDCGHPEHVSRKQIDRCVGGASDG